MLLEICDCVADKVAVSAVEKYLLTLNYIAHFYYYLSNNPKKKVLSHPDRMGGTLSLKLESSYQNPGSLRNLLKILPVPNRAHFCSLRSSTFPGICASHWVCLGVTAPKAPTTTGTTTAVVFPVLSSSSCNG